MTRAQILALKNSELDEVVYQRELDDQRTRAGLPFRTFAEIKKTTFTKRHLIKGVLAWGETSSWIAPPGGLKSALMSSAAIAVAGGDDWFGRRNKGRAAVVYFALERADLVRRRLQAHRERDGLGDLPIAVVAATINLMSPKAVPALVGTLNRVEDEFGLPVGLSIFDTFAKLIAAGGGDEDKARDQGAVFSNLGRFKNSFSMAPHIALIGHTGKDESRGSRGSNALVGDNDMTVQIGGSDIRTATVTKGNDIPEGLLFSFKSENHDFGPDEDGDPITVNIISRDSVQDHTPMLREPRLTKNQQTLFAMLHAAGSSGLTLETWNNQAREAGIGVKRKADLNDIRNALLSKQMVRQYGDRWSVDHT